MVTLLGSISYSFCRVADDLIDHASSVDEARARLVDLRAFLDVAYSTQDSDVKGERVKDLVESRFAPEMRAALFSLPVAYLSATPLYELLEGFETDLIFQANIGNEMALTWPIVSEGDLELYSLRVAGTVAELCLDLVFYHAREKYNQDQRQRLIQAGRNMGIALQLVNIARDIAVDADMQRVYVPQHWLEQAGLTADDVLKQPESSDVISLRRRLLDKAQAIYRDARTAIEEVPPNGRRGMRVAVESYMEIGRVLLELDPTSPSASASASASSSASASASARLKRGQASVPKLRRLRVAWQALNQS